MLKRWIAALAAVAVLASAGAAAEPKPLALEVMRAGAGSLFANVTLVKGERDAVLIDVPFTNADAHRVVAMVLESGRHLTRVFVTHDHPDHFFAMQVITAAFPSAEVIAHPVVVADIWRSLPAKVARWSPMLGANGPAYPSAPHAMTGDVIELEGRQLRVLGPMQGDHKHATAIWIPSTRALIGGDLVFNEVHLWLGEHRPANVAGWAASLEKLADLKPVTVVAGHAKPGLPNDASGLAFSQRYLAEWQLLSKTPMTSDQFKARIRAAFPDTIDVLDDFILTNSADVATGKQPPWEE